MLTIGAFAQRCGLSRSALRFYDDCDLLQPLAVDQSTGYRYYAVSQVADAALVRRLRAAEVPVEEVRRFMAAGADGRRDMLAAHAARLDERAGILRRALDEVREELDRSSPGGQAGWCAISAGVLGAGLDDVRFAAAQREQRPELSGIWAEASEGSLRLVATDSHRLAVRDLVADIAPESAPLRGFIPLDRADELRALLAGTGTVRLRQQPDGTLEAVLDDGGFLAIGGPGKGFPDYEAFLQGTPRGYRCVADRRALASALAGSADNTARIRFGPGALVVRSGGKDASVEASWDGPELCMTVNPSYLTETLDVMVGPDVVVEASDALLPITLRSADTGTFTVLTMPIRPLR
jgi:DNA-binding transcriptional MerR regulator